MFSQFSEGAQPVVVNFIETQRVLVQNDPGPVRVCVRAPKGQDHQHIDPHKIYS
jgi:hypothetical protein